MNTQSLALALLLTTLPAFAAQTQSPAEKRIERANLALQSDPAQVRQLNDLAMALARRGRETADPKFYDEAQEAIARSMELAPDNLEARRIQVWTLLGQHEFGLALVHAKELNRVVPDDVTTYGLLADAHIEVGELAEAEEAVRWMLKLRPGNVAGMTRAAYLRELFGDVEGSLDLMLRAYHSIDPSEVEDRAWTLTHAAHLELSRGRLESAELLLGESAKLFPDYHYQVAQMAELRRAQGRDEEEVALRELHVRLAPHPENVAELAWSLQRVGKLSRAQQLLAEFEGDALAESESWDNANRELIRHFIQTSRPRAALRLARHEMARRQDLHTRHAYAWSLHAAGHHEEARAQIEATLEVGVLDAVMLYHAGAIAKSQQDFDAAEEFLRRSLQQNSHSSVADQARDMLEDLQKLAE